ncbi:MAG: RNA polymerase sigma-70 factor [Tannerellaceae bacterium]|nr:RNA polymerase sigma-70 factor [Tannerellaceae bacterium]
MREHTDDIFLLRRLQEGDERVFKYLFDTYFTTLCRFSFYYCRDTSVAEDIVIDLFGGLWEKRESLEIRISIKSYLFQSVRNKTFNYLRDNDSSVVSNNLELVKAYNEENSIELKELESLIEEAIYTLPEKCKEVFLKSRKENLTNKEIASGMDITTKTVEAQITKALKHIKAYLGKSYSYLW